MPSRDEPARTSRQRYLRSVQDYKQGRLDEQLDAARGLKSSEPPPHGAGRQHARPAAWLDAERRQYVREYLRWLWPHRYRVATVFALALAGAGLQMVEPLFMRFIIDRVLLNADLSAADRVNLLHLAGSLFVGVVIVTQLVQMLKDYRQRLLNTRVMLSLRRSLFERLLHLPLPRLWDMKTGGILSRITGDVDTTTSSRCWRWTGTNRTAPMRATRRGSSGKSDSRAWTSNTGREGPWCRTSTSSCRAAR
jgi:ATP-binding cassette subfamily B protein/subfamily B ATP-binding cassette protein MsbA